VPVGAGPVKGPASWVRADAWLLRTRSLDGASGLEVRVVIGGWGPAGGGPFRRGYGLGGAQPLSGDPDLTRALLFLVTGNTDFLRPILVAGARIRSLLFLVPRCYYVLRVLTVVINTHLHAILHRSTPPLLLA
jgi:hypothetical protein